MQMMDNADIYTVGRYSVEHNMASIMVGRSALRRVCSLNDVAYTEGAKCITLSSPLPFDTSDYKTWSNYIKTSSRKKENRWVYTAVSYHLPEGEYIPDGMNFFTRNVKRLLDMIFSALAMVIFSPLFLITYIMVRMEDGGPAIFKQERVGRYGRTFNIYKFRSMRLDAEKFGPQLSHSGGSDDPRLTKVGRFIRAHHLDEMPQLWNVFIGDMAFVGPRPERKYYIDMIMEYDKRYECLYQIRPGVTSYATLYNGYTDTMEKMLRRLEYDLYYLGHRSWWFDLKILFYTFCSIVFGKKF
jgi:lipopolysaccharide/colanic/teichoic acid biosynthesis glycosyltransferase